MKPRILFIAPLPPPVHGSAVVSRQIKDSVLINEVFTCDWVNLSASRKTEELWKNKPVKLFRMTAAYCKTFFLLLRHRYDLCYLAITCHGKPFLKDAPFVLLCKLFGRRIVIHQHNKGMAKDLAKWPYSFMLPLVYKNTTVCLLSWRLYPDIEQVVPKNRVVVCHNGIVVDKEVAAITPHIGEPRLLFLSNLIESKGVLVLLDALQLLKERGYGFICTFVGGQTKEISFERFSAEVQKRHLEGLVVSKGALFGNEKEQAVGDSDIFVFPTFYDNECFPLVLLEAMSLITLLLVTMKKAYRIYSRMAFPALSQKRKILSHWQPELHAFWMTKIFVKMWEWQADAAWRHFLPQNSLN